MVNIDTDFYSHDRPEHPLLPEDRPRGGGPRAPVAHSRLWIACAIVIAFVLVALVGIVLFP
ncbi:hypothetical protein ACIOJD_30995 [Streptomyces sp. NPDC088116]|uniref:hypothetical protein n=1 Tax=Streptomyces sp. NPDC088116 TaxID=3365825 RepID=UPI003830598E